MDVSLDLFCVNDDVYCRCRSCRKNQINGGTCSHCFCCMDGEKSMDVCEEYRSNGTVIWEK